MHLWCGRDLTGSAYGVGVDPGMGACSGGSAKVEYPHNLQYQRLWAGWRGTLMMERKRCPDAAASSDALGE